jgi:hypothetical protein
VSHSGCAAQIGGRIDDPGYNRPLDSLNVLAYECAGGNQWK